MNCNAGSTLRVALALAALTSFLAGCGTGRSEALSAARPACPHLTDYTAEQKARADDELNLVRERHGDAAVVITMMTDFATTRQEIRACRGGN